MGWWGVMIVLAGVGPPVLELAGRFDERRIPEASGIVRSRRFPGIFWVHNDSGNGPVLFAIHGDGTIVSQFRLAVPNIDWEDIAIDDRGHLYVADVGNNGGLLRVRGIYRVDEPDPGKAIAGAIVPSASYYFALPAGNRFDAESLIVEEGVATLIVKAHDGRDASMYTLELTRPGTLARPAPLVAVGRLVGFREPATGAGVSRDGRMLAVSSTSVARIYRRGDGRLAAAWELLSEVHYPAMAAEGVAWDGNDLVLAVEHFGLYRIRERTWRDGERMIRGSSGRSVGEK